jgi:hypothetical protein
MTIFGSFFVAIYESRFLAPFSIDLAKKLQQAAGSKFLNLWQVAMSLRYTVTVNGLSFAFFRAHAT